MHQYFLDGDDNFELLKYRHNREGTTARLRATNCPRQYRQPPQSCPHSRNSNRVQRAVDDRRNPRFGGRYFNESSCQEQTPEDYVMLRRKRPNKVPFKRLYEEGHLDIGTLGESSRKFDYNVRYSRTPKRKQKSPEVIPLGWGLNSSMRMSSRL
ncbi:hypothetical protein ACJRO7_008954 [Eucalyptus globulus]|uniref:Uncharacterized protein n=1 Tax=Eucalyptus globulus TaxID=34317 RepID=A0ABD3ISZ2_EUCGL